MYAVQYHEYGGREKLQRDEIERPEPSTNELLVEIRAAGVNPVDTAFREGSLETDPLPIIPGSDYAGVVVDIGDGIEEFEPGDRVFGTSIGGRRYGGYAEYAAIAVDHAATLPDEISFDVGGASGIVAGTAFRGLIDHAGLQPTERCLIHGGSGGVGHAAVQIAAATSAQVITTAAPQYHDRLRELGADFVYDYNRDDLLETIREDVGGVDVIMDYRLDDYLQFDVDVAADTARIIGVSEVAPPVQLTEPYTARKKDLEIIMTSIETTPDWQALLDKLAYLMQTGKLTIDVDRSYGLDEAAEAHRAVREDSFFGKILIDPAK